MAGASSATELVGRERELARISAALAAGQNVVLSGRYGSGRTALVRRVAEESAGRFRFVFVDLAAPPREAWATLSNELAPRRPRAGGRRAGSRTLRARVLQASVAGGAPPAVVVLDDVGRLTSARLDLVRRLSLAGRFRLVAVVEGFLPAAERARLLTWLAPVERLRLGPLAPVAVRRFLARAAAERGLGWSADRIAAVASGTAGHPLAMRLAIERGEEDRR